MSELGYHIRLRLRDPRPIVTSPEERRLAARVLLTQGRKVGLFSCDLPADHVHVGARCNRAQAGLFAQAVGSSLKQRLTLPVGFAQYAPKPIADGRLLYNLVRYGFRQPDRHGVDVDPYREASNLPDLLGLRMLGAFTIPNLRALLPRLRREELLSWYGVPSLEPADGPIDQVLDATLRAAALPSLVGSRPQVIAARRAALEVMGSRTRRIEEITDRMAIGKRTVAWLRSSPADPTLVRSIRLQLGLHAVIGARGHPERPF